ncbi:MAG: hypothetical protein JSW71_04230 [Gemmatimonadota bacterium]|nr:MAG: hypothetical protein JSW71_04230 [Gemmatimonadota bacterium]
MTLLPHLKNMLELSQTNVVCCIYDSEAARRVRIAVEREGARPLPLCWQAVIQGAKPGSDWSALIYDLEPRNERTSEVVAAFRSNTLAGPILLYPPPAHDIGPYLESHLGRPDVCLRLQHHDAHEVRDLSADVRRVLNMVPCNRLAGVVRNAADGMPERLLAYAREALNAVAMKDRGDKLLVGDVARRIRTATRTLERLSNERNLPRPKELLDWMILLYVTFVMQYEGVTWARITRRLGLCPRTLYRIRRRLLSIGSQTRKPAGRISDGNSLDCILIAFAERCQRSRESHITERRLADREPCEWRLCEMSFETTRSGRRQTGL